MSPLSRAGSPLAFICQPYHRGGVTRWMVEAAGEWRARGHETWFVVPYPVRPFPSGAGRPTVIELLDALPADRQPKRLQPRVGVEFELGTTTYRGAVYARPIERSVPAGTPVIVSDDAAAWTAGFMLAHRNPFVGVLHADDSWYYGLTERYASSASALVAVSERVARKARAVLVETRCPVTRIPCGIPIPSLAHNAIERDPRNCARLIWMGRIDERQKRVSDLAAIAEALAARGVRFELEIVGDGYDVPLIQRGLSAQTSRQVRFHGWLPSADVSRMLATADLLLLPSNFEGMPLAGMEALAHGCGVVASSASGLEEYRESREAQQCLWIHNVGDVPGAADAIQSALGLDRASRSACARRFAESEFAITTCMDRYSRMLVEMVPRVNVPSARRVPWLLRRLGAQGIATLRAARRRLVPRDIPSGDLASLSHRPLGNRDAECTA